jgi:hypothetical protein
MKETVAQDRRVHPRHRVCKGAKIAFNNRGSMIDCTIRNLSAAGAGLQIASPVGIPDDFELVFNDGTSVLACRIIWRSATQLGVAFTKPL